jgi:NAD(P)-dependent dehydrogenase (short-subunit alcohol dehydrogenase family)
MYAATKAGVRALVRTWLQELKDSKVVEPSGIEPPTSALRTQRSPS